MTPDQLDHTVMPRGKYSRAKGNPKTPDEVAQIDPSYLVWAWSAWYGRPCSELLYLECKKAVAKSKKQEAWRAISTSD